MALFSTKSFKLQKDASSFCNGGEEVRRRGGFKKPSLLRCLCIGRGEAKCQCVRQHQSIAISNWPFIKLHEVVGIGCCDKLQLQQTSKEQCFARRARALQPEGRRFGVAGSLEQPFGAAGGPNGPPDGPFLQLRSKLDPRGPGRSPVSFLITFSITYKSLTLN